MNNFTLDNHIYMSYIIPMMNDDLMDMIRVSCDECVCDDDIARMEYERGEREREERERQEYWGVLEAQYGPLHRHAYADYEGMGWKD